MRPILFNKNEQSFDTYGLGELNVTKGTATRERNGNYTLYAEIPVNDPMVAILEKEMKLKADAGLRTKNQTFEISRIVKDSSNIVKIYGQHISHKLEYMALRNATAFAGSAYSTLGIWKGALIGDLRFDVWSDIQIVGKGAFDISKMENARQALGGVEGSILDIYGGEYEFDNMTVRLHKQLGRTAPTVLEYGRNILSAESDETIESAYTSVLPFATYTPDKPEGDTSDNQPDPVTVTLPENYLDSKYKDLYAHRRIKVVDFSSEFKSDGKNKDIPTPEKLRTLANDYMERNAIGKPKINIKIEYADLAKTLDYADNGWIEELELCDIVPIYYPQIGLTDETAKVTTVTYDFVNERNESVEFGDIGTNVRATMQNGLAGKVDDIAKAQQAFEDSLPDYLLNAQGNKVWYNRPDDKEHKIGDIWFEKNGIYDRMYVWNGSQWEKRIDTEDVGKIKKEVDKQLEQAKQSTALEIAKADAKAQEALIKAGTIPDTATLSDQIKTLILNSPDLSRKVTETFNNADNGDTIYSKIVTKLSNDFADKSTVNGLLRDTSNIYDKVDRQENSIRRQTLEFNKLTESNKLYERILGTSETGAPDKLSRLVMSSDIFQTEVGQYVNTNGANLLNGSKGPFKPDKKPANFDNNILYKDSTSIYMEQGQEYIVSAKTDGNFTAIHNGSTESDNVVLWLMDDKYQNYQIVSDLKTGTTGTKITWNKPSGTYRLRVNTYRKDPDKLKSVWDVKVEKGSIKSDYTLSLTDQLKADPLIEATRTQMTQLAGSWAVKNLNSNGDVLNSINVLADGTNRIDGRLTHITGQTVIDEAVIDSASLKKVSASKLSGGEADFAKMNVVNFDAKNVTSGTFKGLTFEGGRIKSLDGSLSMDLNNKKIRLNGDNVGIVREFKDYPTQFIRYEAQRENNQNHARTIIGSNRNGSEEWNSASFSGIVIDNNSNNGVDKLFQYGDYNYMRHASGDDGWNFSVVTQTLVPGTWNKNSEIWCRHFVIPKETKSDTDSPTKFIRLDDSVAALWKLWAHALSQIGMTEAMKTVIKGSLGAWSYSRPHI
jgi:phage minor structural protein, N-terminal domain protein|nr:MAG TPA: tail protein [Caudoviricetes sp.]